MDGYVVNYLHRTFPPGSNYWDANLSQLEMALHKGKLKFSYLSSSTYISEKLSAGWTLDDTIS